MRVCLDGSVIRAPMSGVQVSVRQEILSLIMPLADAAVSVVCRDSELAGACRDAGWDVIVPPGWTARPAGRVVWQQLLLPRILRARDAHVLHAFAYTAPLRCPVPYVLNVHDIIALEHPELCSRSNLLHMKTLLPPSIRGAAECIVSTHDVAEKVIARFGFRRESVSVVPLGVDATRFGRPAELPDDFRARIGEGPYILYVGNLEPKKGVGTLLDAYAASAGECGAVLVLAGRSAWRSDCLVARIRDWRGRGRVCWLGRVPDSVLPALYQRAAVSVLPSFVEGFGMPVLEAMAAGVAVVHSDHPALVEAGGGRGLSFPVGDASELAAALRRLLNDSDMRARMAAEGRDYARTCTWARWGEAAARAIRRAAATRRTGESGAHEGR